MEYLNWDLSVLSRAIAYQNLSGAAVHVGISQPQLSRIVSKLEEQFGVVLLDRDARRKAAWTPDAYKLAQLYVNITRQFNADVYRLLEGSNPDHMVVGTLDGLAPLAARFCHHLFETTKVHIVELHVLDLGALEEQFFKGDIDFAFTSREPGRKKFKYVQTLGYQSLDQIGKAGEDSVHVMSPFEYSIHLSSPQKQKAKRVLVANALFIRQHWLEKYGGTAVIPSQVSAKKSPGKELTVVLIGHDRIAPNLWQSVAKF